jgi:UDP-N-acetylmuramoyl-tripeptide--D-alanyl-D-alanine ligase
VGEEAGRIAELLVVVGPGAVEVALGAEATGLDPSRIHRVPDRQTALEIHRPRLRHGDVVLVKASRGMELDRLVDALRTELGEESGS